MRFLASLAFLLFLSTLLSALPVIASSKSFFDSNSGVLPLNSTNIAATIADERSLTFIFFYSPKHGKCRQIRPDWQKLAQLTSGILTVGAVDCLEERALCESHNVYIDERFPVFTLYRGQSTPQKYSAAAATDVKALSQFAYKHLPSHLVHSINQRNMQNTRNPTIPRFIIFTDKDQTSPIVKSLSLRWKDRVQFGEIHKREKKLIDEWGIDKFPTIVMQPTGDDASPAAATRFQGQGNAKEIGAFISEYMAASAASSGDSSHEAVPIPELKDQSCLESYCLSSGRICAILFSTPDAPALPDSIRAFQQLRALRAGERLYEFVWINGVEEENAKWLQWLFNAQVSEFPQLLIFSAKKKRYAPFIGSMTVSSIGEFLDQVKDGRVKTIPLESGERDIPQLDTKTSLCPKREPEPEKPAEKPSATQSSQTVQEEGILYTLTPTLKQEHFGASKSPWMVAFLQFGSQNATDSMAPLQTVAAKLKGMIKFGVIDISDAANAEMIQEFGLTASSEPQIRFCKHGVEKAAEEFKPYERSWTAAELHNFAVTLLQPNKAQFVAGEQGFLHFLSRDSVENPRVLLFTQQSHVPLLIQALALDYPSIYFGVSRSTDAALMQKLNVQAIPSLYLLGTKEDGKTETGQTKLSLQVTKFDGPLGYATLSQFCNHIQNEYDKRPKAAKPEEQEKKEEKPKREKKSKKEKKQEQKEPEHEHTEL